MIHRAGNSLECLSTVVCGGFVDRSMEWRTALWIFTADCRTSRSSIPSCLLFGRRKSKRPGLVWTDLVLFTVLWRCWLGGRKGIRPVINRVVGAGVVVSLEQGAYLHVAQLMPLPLTVSCFSKIQIGFTFLVPAELGSPGELAVKRVCVCVCVCVTY